MDRQVLAHLLSLLTFIKDLVQEAQSFEALKRSFSARLPSNMALQNYTKKLFCETSFQNGASKLYK
jgi:hypothetical protein